MIIRDATPADLPEITRIYADSVLKGVASYEMVAPDEAEMGRRMSAIRDSSYPYLIATDEEGAVLGYAYASAFRTRPAYRWLVEDSIYLAEGARGQGLGKRLLRTCMEFARDKGYADMTLWTHESHKAACALYAANGWQLVSSKPVHSFGMDLVEQMWTITL